MPARHTGAAWGVAGSARRSPFRPAILLQRPRRHSCSAPRDQKTMARPASVLTWWKALIGPALEGLGTPHRRAGLCSRQVEHFRSHWLQHGRDRLLMLGREIPGTPQRGASNRKQTATHRRHPRGRRKRSRAKASPFCVHASAQTWVGSMGRNMRMDLRWGGADNNRIRALARELVGLQPDIILHALPRGKGGNCVDTRPGSPL